jgi:hypothetical protein
MGIDSSDNLNLLQPVNPWLGSSWQIYNEYFQWQPEYNYNSPSQTVQAGDLLFGSLTYTPANQSYTIYHNVSGSVTWEVSSSIKIQKDGRKGGYKNFTIARSKYKQSKREQTRRDILVNFPTNCLLISFLFSVFFSLQSRLRENGSVR